MDWLHGGRDGDFSVFLLHFGAGDFPSRSLIKKSSELCFFRLWRRDPSGFGAVIACAVVYNCIVFCNAMLANRLQLNIVNCIGMAARRLLW